MTELSSVPEIHNWNSIILETTARKITLEKRQALLGDLCYVYASDKRRSKLSMKSFYFWMKPAICHEQIKLLSGLFDQYPSGYIMWAWVSSKTLDDYLSNENFFPHPSQWNEGDNLIIFDVVVPYPKIKNSKPLLKIKDQLLKDGVKSIYYRPQGTLGKVYKWMK